MGAENKKFDFRPLTADEIECRLARVTENGVQILLYKDARVDQKILDETVGPMNWQRTHSRDNANCTVSIWDDEKKLWVSKEDTGVESNTQAAKGLASDSFKRACFNWGIGRELYTADKLNLFVTKDCLQGLKAKGNNGYVCYDVFIPVAIEYGEGFIKSITIDIYCNNKKHHTKTFRRFTDQNQQASNPAPQPRQTAAPVQQSAPQATPVQKKVSDCEAAKLFKDDEIILIGNCKNQTFGNAKNSANFIAFLKYVKSSNRNYKDVPDMEVQYKKFKQLADELL